MDSLHAHEQVGRNATEFFRHAKRQLFASSHSMYFPLPESEPLVEKIKHFQLLLSMKDVAIDIPSNLEVQRRISFFSILCSWISKMLQKCNMLSFSVWTPHYMEDAKYSSEELHSSKEGVSIIFYLQDLFRFFLLYEWENFLEHMGSENLYVPNDDINEEDIRNWCSFRGQTLSRTGE